MPRTLEGLDLVRPGQHSDRAAHGGAQIIGRTSGCCTPRTSRRCRFERVCIRDGHPVAWEDLVKGYEYEKGHFVVLTKEDFQAAAVEKTRTVDIIDFVKADEIDDRFFETPYYLVPAKGGERAYALLREAIRESGRIGIAKFILRDAQHLAAVEVIENAIVLTVMRFADELVDVAAVRPARRTRHPQAGARHGEGAGQQPRRRMGSREVHRRVPREPDADHQGEGEGQDSRPGAAEGAARRPKVVDLMERLRRSLEQAGGKTRGAKARGQRPPRGTPKRGTTCRARLIR